MEIPRSLPGSPAVMRLPHRGVTAYWDLPGPASAPTLVLLHGVTLTAEVNWSGAAPWLTEHYRVVAVDLSGHGRGWVSDLAEHADDIAALVRHLGVGPVVPVGFSMGGLVAQLLWRRHPDLTAGLVLCATSRNVAGSLWDRSAAQLLPAVTTGLSWTPGTQFLGADLVGSGLLDTAVDPGVHRWVLREMHRTPLVTALATIRAACAFSSHAWIGEVDVPTAVVLTRYDATVPPRRQWKLAQAIPGCSVHEIDGGHGVFLTDPPAFAGALLDACAVMRGTACPTPNNPGRGPNVPGARSA